MKKGFTLTEVLATLIVIGIIILCTIPSVIVNVREKANVALYKKSILSIKTALQKAYAQEKIRPNKIETRKELAEVLSRNMNNMSGLNSDDCESGDNINNNEPITGSGCHFTSVDGMQFIFPSDNITDSSGNSLAPVSDTICYASGGVISEPVDDHCSQEATLGILYRIVVDINDEKGPNSFADDFESKNVNGNVKDRFIIEIAPNGNVSPGSVFDKEVFKF